jgi:hypothetical protein
MKMRRARLEDAGLFLIGSSWLAASFSLTLHGSDLLLPNGEPLGAGCWLRAVTGYDCPTCGLSRSFVALFHGNWVSAFAWHPAGPLVAAGTLVALGLIAFYAISGRKPLWGRPGFVRALSLVAVLALSVGVARSLLQTFSG